MTDIVALDPDKNDTPKKFRRAFQTFIDHNSALNVMTGISGIGGGLTPHGDDMQVKVLHFHPVVATAYDGAYVGYQETKTLTIEDGDSEDRHDRVVFQVTDEPGDDKYKGELVVVKGNPGEDLPDVPDMAFPVVKVKVPAGASSGDDGIPDENFEDDRNEPVVAPGGIRSIKDKTHRDWQDHERNIGRVFYQQDDKKLYLVTDSSGSVDEIVRKKDLPDPEKSKSWYAYTTRSITLSHEEWKTVTFAHGDFGDYFEIPEDGMYIIYGSVNLRTKKGGDDKWEAAVCLSHKEDGKKKIRSSFQGGRGTHATPGVGLNTTMMYHYKKGSKIYLEAWVQYADKDPGYEVHTGDNKPTASHLQIVKLANTERG